MKKNYDEILQQNKLLKDKLQKLEHKHKALKENLKKKHFDMEKLVEERTLELQAANQQSNASNQQLKANEQQLRAANQQLIASEKEFQNKNYELIERLKEITCLYNILTITEENNMIDEILEKSVHMIPSGWQYPEDTVARIRFLDETFSSDNVKETKWMQKTDLFVNGKTQGSIEVYYVEEKPLFDEGPFLNEEKKLLASITRIIREALEKILLNEDIKKMNTELKAANQQLSASNQQLSANEQQLRAANQQLIANEQQLRAETKKLKQMEAKKIEYTKELEAAQRATLSMMEDTIEKSEKLKESEEKFRMLVNNSVDIIWQMDLRLNFTYITPNVKEVFGYTQEEFIGTNLSKHATRKEFFKMARIALKNVKNYKTFEYVIFEANMLKKNGEELPVEIIGKILLNKKGFPVALQGATRDITERKQAERALKESENKFRTLVNTLPDYIWLKDVNGVYLNCNPMFEEFFGHKESEIIGKTDYDFVDKELAAFFRKKDMEAMKANGPLTNEEEIVRVLDSRQIILETTKTPMYNEDGSVLGVLGVGHDITDRKAKEEKIKRKERDLRSLIENPAGYVIYRTRLNRDTGQIEVIQVSPSFADILGISQNDIKDFSKWFSNVYQEDLPVLLKANEIGMKPPFKLNLEVRYNHPAKGLKWFEIRSSGIPFDDNPNLIEYANGIILDITERKLAEGKMKELLEEQEMLLNNDPSFIIYKDTKNNIVKITDTVAKLTNMPKEDIEGKPSSIIYPTLADKYYEDDKEVIKSGKPKMGIIEPLPASDGSIKWLLTNKVPVKDKEENVTGIIVFSTDITALKETQDELQEREKRLQEAEEIGKLGHVDWNVAEQRSYWSDEVFRIYERDPKHGVPGYEEIMNLHTPEDAKKLETAVIEALQNGIDYDLDLEAVMPSGQKKNLHIIGIPEKNEKGNITNIKGTLQDITERKAAEEQIKRSLVEKETLLKELYHRTKNNMQVITSMLSMQDRVNKNEKIKEVIQNIKLKVKSMALVHQKLYQSKDLSRINLKEYIHDLCLQIASNYLSESMRISFKFDLKDIYCLMDTAIPLGLLINELVTNAFKYAWPEVTKGEMQIGLTRNKDGFIIFTLADDGVGLKKSFDINKDKNLGLDTVMLLGENQLKGNLAFENKNGVSWKLKFKDDQYYERV